MISFPNAKINIGLNIVRKRDDGFHDIESVFYPIGLTDILEVCESTTGQLELTCSGIEVPSGRSQNLCVQAYELIRSDHKIPPVNIHLHKIIPIGAGLGGGSADGTFTIRALNELFELGMDQKQMGFYAAQLGSDCPFFVRNEPVYVTGRGDIFTPIRVDLKGMYLVLVHPGVHIATSEAYAGVKPIASNIDLQHTVEKTNIRNWEGSVINQFEVSVVTAHPRIELHKDKLMEMGAVYVSMTGSGSAIYGLFDTPQAPSLERNFTDCFVWQKQL